MDKPTNILLGQPAKYPHHIADGLSKRFRSMPEVQAAYLAHCMLPDTDEPEPHTVIGIDAHGEWQPIVEAAIQVLRTVAPHGEIVDFVPIGGDSPISSYMLDNTKPFYKRKRLGLF